MVIVAQLPATGTRIIKASFVTQYDSSITRGDAIPSAMPWLKNLADAGSKPIRINTDAPRGTGTGVYDLSSRGWLGSGSPTGDSAAYDFTRHNSLIRTAWDQTGVAPWVCPIWPPEDMWTWLNVPFTPTVNGTGGSLAAGNYRVRVAGYLVSGNAETPFSTLQTAVVATATGRISIVVTNDAQSDRYRVYMSPVNGAAGTETLQARSVGDGNITSGTTAFTSASAAFTAADVGKTIIVRGAGAAGADLQTTIVSQTGTAAVLTAAAGTTVSNANTSIGNGEIMKSAGSTTTIPDITSYVAGVSQMLTSSPGTIGDLTWVAWGNYLHNLIAYYNRPDDGTGTKPTTWIGAALPTPWPPPANLGVAVARQGGPAGPGITNWETWNEPNFGTENYRYAPSTEPPTPALSKVVGGTLTAGDYSYQVAAIDHVAGQSQGGTIATITLTANDIAANNRTVRATWTPIVSVGFTPHGHVLFLTNSTGLVRSPTTGEVGRVGKNAIQRFDDTGAALTAGAANVTNQTGGPGARPISPLMMLDMWNIIGPLMRSGSTAAIKLASPTTAGALGFTAVLSVDPLTGVTDAQDYLTKLSGNGGGAAGLPDTYSGHLYGVDDIGTSTDLTILAQNLGRMVIDAVMTLGSPTVVTSATAAFVAADVGQVAYVAGAGVAGADLDTTIASVTNATTAVLTVGAATAVSAAVASFGYITTQVQRAGSLLPTRDLDITEFAVSSASGRPGAGTAFGVAFFGAYFARIAKLDTVAAVLRLVQFQYAHSPGLTLIDAASGRRLPYWAMKIISSGLIPGSKILTVTGAPAGVDVLAVALAPGFTQVRILVVNSETANGTDIGGIGVGKTVTLDITGATIAARRLTIIDSGTPLATGPATTTPSASPVSVTFAGYGLAVVEFDTQSSAALTPASWIGYVRPG